MRIELYKFTSNSESWCYTSADRDITYNTDTYTAVPISSGNRRLVTKLNKTDLQITTKCDLALVSRYLTNRPESSVTLTMYSGTYVDGTITGDVADTAIWKGRIISVEVKDNEANITCEPVYTSLARAGLRAMYQTLCRHVLYSDWCGLDKADYKQTSTITTFGNPIIVARTIDLGLGTRSGQGEYDRYFKGGFLIYNGTYRWITQHTAADDTVARYNTTSHKLTLDRALVQVGTQDSVDIYPGCSHTMLHCKYKFDADAQGNLENYGGFPCIPGQNPFNGIEQ